MDAVRIKQFAGNLKHAAFTGKGATIGGGKFSAAECKAAAIALDAAPAMLAALQEILADQETMREPYRNEAICERIRAAIAAATGAPTDETGAAAPTDEPAREYMAFCQQADGRGTIWIDKVRGDTIEAATAAAREACAADWGCKADKVHCLGLIEGAATVAHWQDVCEGGL